jgi:cell division protease FtsH
MGMRGTDSTEAYSQTRAAVIDAEVAELIHTAHQEAFDVLVENRDVLDELVRELFRKETLNKQEVAEVFRPLRRREKRSAWTGSDLRIPSELPPVDVPTAPAPARASLPTVDQHPPAPEVSPWAPPSAPPTGPQQ